MEGFPALLAVEGTWFGYRFDTLDRHAPKTVDWRGKFFYEVE